MDPERSGARSHLFTVRLWTEQVSDDQVEWRGRVRHVLSGAYCYFRGWATLATYLETKLREFSREETP